MNIEVIRTNDSKLISNLLQIYLSDVCNYFQMDMDQETGLYLYDDTSKYFENNNTDFAYIIKCDEKLAGFSLIDFVEDSFVVQEMFVLNEYKGKGIGENAITKIFDMHKGNWIIKSLPGSPKAESFWNKTVSKYTNNKFEIDHIGKYNRAVFTFNNSK
jgi:predicted acetyltransferase